MTLVQDNGINSIEFSDRNIVEIFNDNVEKTVEMGQTFLASVDVVLGSNTVQVSYMWLDVGKNLRSFLYRQRGQLCTMRANMENVFIIISVSLEWR